MPKQLFPATGRQPAGRIGNFQQRLAQIEEDFAAGRIGPAMRRDLLEQARDSCGIPLTLAARAQPGGLSGKLVGTNDNQINAAKRAGRVRHDRPR